MGSSQVHRAQEFHRIEQLDFRLFRHEAPAAHHRGTYQRHPTGNDTRRRPAGLWRGSESVSVDWCHTCHHLLCHAFAQRQERGYRLQAQQMDLLHRAGCRSRCNKRSLRQVSDGSTREWWCRIRQNDCAELVQHLPVFPHGSHAADDMVAYQEEFYPIPLALEHHLHQYLPFGSRLRLFLRSESAWRHDQYREHDSPRFGHRQLPLRCSHLPREESQGEVRRSAPGITRNALPLLRNEVMIIKKSCKPMCLQDFFMFLPDMCTLVLRNKELVALLDVECLIP